MPGRMSSTRPSAVQTEVAMLPCSVRVNWMPLPKSMWTNGTGRTVCQTGSKFADIKAATCSLENNTVLARRAFVQENSASSLPIMWNSNTGLPDLPAAWQASANVACQCTLPGATRALTNALPGAATVTDWCWTTPRAGGSIVTVLAKSAGTD